MTAPKPKSKNPLQSVAPASYDLTQRGRFNQNLQILAAMKADQGRFLKSILKIDREKVKNSGDVFHCGQWIFMRHYIETGERRFAGGYGCNSPYCMLCRFRKVYSAARECHDFVLQHLVQNPRLSLLYRVDRLESNEAVEEQFKECKQRYSSTLKNRACLLDSIGGYHISTDGNEWQVSVKELLLIDQRQLSFTLGAAFQVVPVSSLFQILVGIFLCWVPGADGCLDKKQQAQVLEMLTGAQPYVPHGCFMNFEPGGKVVFDRIEERLADQDYKLEQYRFDKLEKHYVLQTDSGDNNTPFEGIQYLTSKKVSKMNRRFYKALRKAERLDRCHQYLASLQRQI